MPSGCGRAKRLPPELQITYFNTQDELDYAAWTGAMLQPRTEGRRGGGGGGCGGGVVVYPV